jgi:hypothetical protein
MSPWPRFFFWGVLLGSGVGTLIPYSSFLILLGAQLTSGPAVGGVSGALFGGTRAAMALIPPLRRYNVEKTLDLLPKLRRGAQLLNIGVALAAMITLVLVAWR